MWAKPDLNLQIEILAFAWCQFNLKRCEAGACLRELTRANERQDGERLVQYPREGDIDRLTSFFFCEFDGTCLAFEVVLRIPAIDERGIGSFVGVCD